MQFKLLRDTSGLGNSHHVESELLKDAMVSEGIGLRQHLSVDGLVAKSEVFGLLGMGGCYICEFPEASAAHELTEHQNQQMVPMRHGTVLSVQKRMSLYAYLLRFRIGCKGRHFKTRTGYRRAKTLCMRILFFNLNNFKKH